MHASFKNPQIADARIHRKILELSQPQEKFAPENLRKKSPET
jgi:hypothetical protein